jgi:hypothetical protein
MHVRTHAQDHMRICLCISFFFNNDRQMAQQQQQAAVQAQQAAHVQQQVSHSIRYLAYSLVMIVCLHYSYMRKRVRRIFEYVHRIREFDTCQSF